MSRLLSGTRRTGSVIALASAFVLSMGGLAHADQVRDSIETVGGVQSRTIVSGETITVNYYIFANSSGSLSGCDATVASPVTVTIVKPAGVTASTTSLEFSSCGDENTNTKPVVFGSTTPNAGYGISVTTSDDVGSYVGSNAAFTLVVTEASAPDGDGDGVADADDNCPDVANPGQENTYGDSRGDACEEPPAPSDTTDPVVTVHTPAGANGAGWYSTDPISVPVSATDDTGVTSFTCTLDGNNVTVTNPGTVSVGEGTHTVACEAADAAGNTGGDSEEFKVDATDPVVTVTPPATGLSAAGWYKTDPISVDVSASDDNLTGFTCSVDGTDQGALTAAGDTIDVTGNGSHTVACSATDAADNTGSDSEDVKIDTELPTISHTLDKTANGLGWFNEPVTADFTCDDLVSLIATCEGDHTFNEGENQNFTGKATDNADNESEDPITDIDVDLTPPDLNISGRDSGTYDICATEGPITRPSFAPSDALSGVQSSSDSWTPPSTSTGVGSYVYTATATDNADNETNGGRAYTLNYGSAAFSGPLQPINADGSSRFKLGSTVPVKFRLACNGVAIPGANATLTVKKADSYPDPGTNEAVSTSKATTGNKFRWSGADEQYIFNLSTKAGYTNPGSSSPTAFTPGTWTFTIRLDDGSTRSFNLQLVR